MSIIETEYFKMYHRSKISHQVQSWHTREAKKPSETDCFKIASVSVTVSRNGRCNQLPLEYQIEMNIHRLRD